MSKLDKSDPPIASGGDRSGQQATPAPQQRLGLILGLLVIAQFAVVVDYSIVQIALPTIRADLLMSISDEQWIISAYGLTFACFLLLSGRLSDIYGRKRLFLIGFMIFSLSSLAAGLAPSELILISARIVQGFGAAMMSATGLALITRIFAPLGKLNMALGIFTAVSSAGFSAGVLLGGFITEALGWRWIFFVNVPVGIIATVLALRALPDPSSGQTGKRHLDVPGAATITGGLMLLVYGLSELGSGDTSYLTYLSFLASGLILASFIAIERRSAAPIMPLSFIRRRTIFFANATALLTFAAQVPWVFLLASYLQVILGYSPIDAAAAMVPAALVFFFVGGFGAPILVKRLGAKSILVGAMLAFTIGLLLISRVSADADYTTDILPGMLIGAIGGALSLTASNIAALSGANRGEEGIASGLINTSRQVGGPIGLAMVVTVVGLLTNGLGVTASTGDVVLAFHYGFIAIAGFTGLAVATSLLLTGKAGKPPPVVDAAAPKVPPVPIVRSEPG